MLNAMINVYNEEYQPLNPIKEVNRNKGHIDYTCTIKGFINKSYGKYGKGDVD